MQNLRLKSPAHEPKLYEHIAHLAQHEWNTNQQLGLVVGATYPSELKRVREIAPTLPLLIPGIGAQGGDAMSTVRAAWVDESAPVVISSSRAILYASKESDFASASRAAASQTRELLENCLKTVLSEKSTH